MNDKTNTVEIYTCNDLTETDLVQLLDKAKHNEPSFAIWERIDDICFPKDDAIIKPAQWEQGRLFNQSLELCWKRVGDSYETVLTTEANPPGVLDEKWGPPTAYTWIREERSIYLWGENDPQIGRSMDYKAIGGPSGPNERAQIVLAVYHEIESYRLCHYRYVTMQREKGA